MDHLHFIITRFNVRMGTDKDKRSVATLSDEWHDERFRIFERICFPSVTNQLRSDFHWLIFFDSRTEPDHRERIRTYDRSTPNIQTMFCDDIADMNAKTAQVIEERIRDARDARRLVTTRLDNDDALRNDFTLLVGNAAKESSDRRLIDCLHGYQLIIDKSDRAEFLEISDEFGPFLSLVEPIGNHVTINERQHRRWRDASLPRTCIDGKAMWIQTIHSRNVLNEPRKNGLPAYPNDLRDFACDFEPYVFDTHPIRKTARRIVRITKTLARRFGGSGGTISPTSDL